MFERLVQWLILQWAAVLWTVIGALGGRWTTKLLRRWIPAYLRYRRERPTEDGDRDYAWSRLMKSLALAFLNLTVLGMGTLVLLGPVGQGNSPSFRGYVVLGGFLVIDACATYVCYLMNREDERQMELP